MMTLLFMNMKFRILQLILFTMHSSPGPMPFHLQCSDLKGSLTAGLRLTTGTDLSHALILNAICHISTILLENLIQSFQIFGDMKVTAVVLTPRRLLV